MSGMSITNPTRLGFSGSTKVPDVGHTEWTEELFALGRGEPVILVLHIVVGHDGGHRASYGSYPAARA